MDKKYWMFAIILVAVVVFAVSLLGKRGTPATQNVESLSDQSKLSSKLGESGEVVQANAPMKSPAPIASAIRSPSPKLPSLPSLPDIVEVTPPPVAKTVQPLKTSTLPTVPAKKAYKIY